MSKQSVDKTRTGAGKGKGTGMGMSRGTTPAAGQQAQPPRPGYNGPTRPAPTARPRPPAPPVAKKRSGAFFKLRPMDIALVGVGLALVIAIIWAGLGGTGTGTISPGSSPGDSSSARSTIPVGQPAPDFSLPAANGQTYSLSQFKGKVVVLEFFAPWCPHCQADAPMFNELYDAYKDKDVQFLAVSATPYGRNYSQTNRDPITMDDIKWFQDTYGVKFPMLFDKDLKAADQYGIAFYPTVYIVDRNGNVASIPTGDYTVGPDGNPQSKRETAITKDELAAEIDRVVQAK